MFECNMNSYVVVELTKLGQQILESYADESIKEVGANAQKRKNQIMDMSTMTLWRLMMIFGPHLHQDAEPVFAQNRIRIKVTPEE